MRIIVYQVDIYMYTRYKKIITIINITYRYQPFEKELRELRNLSDRSYKSRTHQVAIVSAFLKRDILELATIQ